MWSAKTKKNNELQKKKKRMNRKMKHDAATCMIQKKKKISARQKKKKKTSAWIKVEMYTSKTRRVDFILLKELTLQGKTQTHIFKNTKNLQG